MNLGLVAEAQRLPDSADTVIAVEPIIGSTSRTKGSLFLLVTGAGGRKLREATKVIAERIRDDYYYDLSAGISVCLRKAVRNANNVLLHSPERPAQLEGEAPPIGLALAVVRGNELYVATMGPAEAYLIRQARLLTLPDAGPERGLPAEEVDGPEVWHGDITMGDCLILISPNVTNRIGLGPIQDTVGQLHPQGAVDEIHRQFGSGSLGSTGGDGLIVVEATEVASTHRAQPLKPVWPSESRAGAPERSPIPLADTVVGGMVAVQGSARHVQATADGWLRRGAYSLFDRMPQRAMSRGRVTPMTVHRERQQRAALAVIGLLTVVAVVGTSMWFLAGANKSEGIDAMQRAQQAYANVQSDLKQVYGAFPNLTETDPQKAADFLKDAYTQLKIAGEKYSPALLAGQQAQVVAGLNSYYGVTMLQPKVVASFTTDDLEGLVLGSDGAAYLIDSTVSTVYRVDLQTGVQLPILKAGQDPGGGIVGNPRVLATGGPDVLILDDFNSVWRWRPAAGSTSGRGTPIKLNIPDNTTWGRGARALGTFITNPQVAQYNLYIVVPSASQILKYVPASDGSKFPVAGRTPYLSVAQDVSTIDDMYIDGKIYLVDKGQITQWSQGQKVTGWSPDPPGSRTGEKKGDILLRPNGPVYTRLTADNPTQDQGTFYAYDGLNRRIVAFTKSGGTFVGQYMVPATMPWLSALKGLFVTTGANGTNPTLYWIESSKLMSASLNPSSAPTSLPSASLPSASLRPSSSTSSGQSPSAGPSRKP